MFANQFERVLDFIEENVVDATTATA